MASSRKSSKGKAASSELAARVAARLEGVVKPADRVVAALSGGVDSVVLLDCLQRAAPKLKFRLSALHVNHQFSPNAARWSGFCGRICRARGVPFQSVKVNVPAGESLEAAARAARYAQFARLRCDYVALGHHRDDQVETFLLQLLRGAGVKGLAAMPFLKSKVERRKSKGNHASLPAIVRPLLEATRQEILDYAKTHGLQWIEDESNADAYFLRNYLRHEALPVIARRFPAYRATIARSVGHLAEAARLLDEVAAADGEGHIEGGALRVEALRALPAARARNLLRAFLAGHGVAMPGAERIGEALRQALAAKRDAQVQIQLGGSSLRRHAGFLHVVRAGKIPLRYARRWRGEKWLALDEIGGVLTLTRTTGAGISVAQLRSGPVTIRLRRGGERLQPDRRRPRRALKNLLQEARIAPWLRERLPLIFHDDALVWAPGIGIDCAFQAQPGEAALAPRWSLSA